jgi:hypothetical protein
MELAKLNPQGFPAKVVMKLAPIPNRQKVIEMLEQAEAEAAASQQQTIKLQVEAAIADIEKTRSETAKNTASANKTEIEAVSAAMNATAGAMPAQPPPGSTGDTGASAVI